MEALALALFRCRSEIVLAVVEAQVTLAEQFGMQAAKSLADPYALREMGFL